MLITMTTFPGGRFLLDMGNREHARVDHVMHHHTMPFEQEKRGGSCR